MQILLTISNLLIPIIIFGIVVNGLIHKKDVYTCFTNGAEEGFRTVIRIMPTLIGLMIAVGILRASGFLEFLSNLLSPIFAWIRIPGEAVPVLLVKMFSSSASTGLVLDIFKTHGPDSYIGNLVSLAMACSETIFYTMSVYFVAANIKKTRYTLAGALLATVSGLVASVILAGMM